VSSAGRDRRPGFIRPRFICPDLFDRDFIGWNLFARDFIRLWDLFRPTNLFARRFIRP
jgi:hypothetical protein